MGKELPIIITTVLIVTMLGLSVIPFEAEGETWTQTSDADFSGGTLDNIDVIGLADSSYLQVDTTGSGGEFVRIDDGPDAGLYSPATCWDSRRNQVVLFGGVADGRESDTWLYDPATDTWTLSTSSSHPSARQYFDMVYDSTHDKVVLFGGYDGSLDDETWIYDPAIDGWEQVYPLSHPSARQYHKMVFESVNNRVVLFGGDDGSANDGTWVYDVASNTWTKKNPTTKPSARWGHAMAFDPSQGKVVLFGGFDTNRDDETWTYDVSTNTWTQKSPSSKPSGRYFPDMVYDSKNQVMILFGGDSSGGYEHDSWKYSLSSDIWTQLSPSQKPTNRRAHSMEYDDSRGKVLLFSGSASIISRYANFYYETVDDSTIEIGLLNDIVLDDEGHAHISYHDATSKDVEYAEWTGSTWSLYTVDDNVDQGPTAIDMDLQGYPHIIYRDSNGDLMHGYKDSTGWHTEIADDSHDDMGGDGLDLTIDRFGNLHIAYFSESGSDLYYVQGTTGSWGTPQGLDTTDAVGYRPAITVDNDGNPHIAYGDDTNEDLDYISSSNGGSSWNSVEIVDNSIVSGYEPECSIAVDLAGTPYISYQGVNGKLGFAYKYDPTWGTELITNSDWSGMASSLTLDRNGRPHITCYDGIGTDIEYHWLDRSGIWRNTVVDGAAHSTVQVTACALDTHGRLHVSYYDSGADLAYAKLLLPTWEYDLSDNEWTPRGETRDGPSDRMLNAMVYDEKVQKMVLFGGYDNDVTLDGSNFNNETWIYDPATRIWQKQFPPLSPSSRWQHTMVFDSVNGVTVLFGGYDGTRDDETWTYDAGANTWTNKNPSSQPLARYEHGMAYDAGSGLVVLFGGYDTSYDDETWVYNVGTNKWTNKNPAAKPSARDYHAMVYDPNFDKIVLFGGNTGTRNDETWTYDTDTNTWTNKNPTTKPSARYAHDMVYDSVNSIIILFGGYTTSGAVDDTWTYSLSSNNWSARAPVSSPEARSHYDMAFDPESGQAVVFGGDGSTYLSDTQLYRLTDYETSGTYTSEAYSAHADASVKWGTIHWNTEVPTGADVEFQVGVSDDGTSFDFVGPDGTSNTFYNDVTGGDLYSNSSGKWVCYKAYLRAAPSGDTPELHDVTITWREIEDAAVQLYSPNGGEDLMRDEYHIITWEASGDLGSTPINLYYSTNGGTSWTDIANDIANSGFYNWTVPNIETATGLVMVTCEDIYGNNVSDVCDRTFAIDPPPGTPTDPNTMDRIVTPASGNVFAPGAPLPLTWQLRDTETDSVSIYYSLDFGENWVTIIEDIPNTEYYTWRIPEDMTSDNVMIKVEGGEVSILSGIFNIEPDQSLPDGNQSDNEKHGDTNVGNQLIFYGFITILIGLVIALGGVVKWRGRGV